MISLLPLLHWKIIQQKEPFLTTSEGHRDIIPKGGDINIAALASLPFLLLKTDILLGAHPPQFFAKIQCLHASQFTRPKWLAKLK